MREITELKALHIVGFLYDFWVMANEEGNLQREDNTSFMKRISAPHKIRYETRYIFDIKIRYEDLHAMTTLPKDSIFCSEDAFKVFKSLWDEAEEF